MLFCFKNAMSFFTSKLAMLSEVVVRFLYLLELISCWQHRSLSQCYEGLSRSSRAKHPATRRHFVSSVLCMTVLPIPLWISMCCCFIPARPSDPLRYVPLSRIAAALFLCYPMGVSYFFCTIVIPLQALTRASLLLSAFEFCMWMLG